MRIAQIAPVYPPYRGGMGTVAAEYTRLLRDEGDTVDVFAPSTLRPIFSYGHGAILPQLLWKLRGYDALHLHYPFFGSDILVALACVLWRVPLFVTFHMRPKANGWLGGLFRLYRFVVERWILRAAQVVFVSSFDYAASVHLTHPRLMEMPFGINTRRFTPGNGAAWRMTHGIGEKEKVILFVGGLDKAHYFKGVEVLLRAMCRVMGARLVIVGSGSEKERFEAEARALGVGDRALFVGSTPFEELPEVYRAADVHVLPSIDRSEAWGLVTLEAAATGIPSVVSDLPGVRTIVVPEETGWLVSPGDAQDLARVLQGIVDTPERCQEMGSLARKRAEREYDDKQLIHRLREIYQTGKLPTI